MTIQRQYSLPNCRLVLQGMSNDGDSSGRPIMSMVTNVECYLAGQKTPITGGRAFLDSLTQTVSRYAQGYLSGIQNLVRRDRREQTGLVQLEQVSQNLHRLTVQPEETAGTPTEIDLTTVQLFDLAEAVDQFFADAQTLPDLGLQLDPIPKRHIAAAEPLAKRAAPAALGLSGLAAAAAVLFFLPTPQVRRPEEPTTSSSPATQTTPDATPGASPTPAPGSPVPETSPANSASPTNAPPSSPIDSPAPASPSTSSPSSSTGTTGTTGTGLALADQPGITDPTELDRLTVQLYDQLDLGWKQKPSFDGELIYRVGVDRAGKIRGYKYTNDAALTYVGETPLADVQFDPPAEATSSPAAAESLAQFRVVFKSDGVLEVSPWDGQPDGQTPASESPAASPTAP
ncbi:MAG: DUF4335 domain-containing protein [Elainella sp.]